MVEPAEQTLGNIDWLFEAPHVPQFEGLVVALGGQHPVVVGKLNSSNLISKCVGILHLETDVDEALPVVPHLNAAVIADPAHQQAVPAVAAVGGDGLQAGPPVLALDHSLALPPVVRGQPQPHGAVLRAGQELLLDLGVPVTRVDLNNRKVILL